MHQSKCSRGRARSAPEGRAYSAPRGGAYSAPGGRAYSAPGGGVYPAPGGRAYSASGGRAYSAPGRRAHSAPGGWAKSVFQDNTQRISSTIFTMSKPEQPPAYAPQPTPAYQGQPGGQPGAYGQPGGQPGAYGQPGGQPGVYGQPGMYGQQGATTVVVQQPTAVVLYREGPVHTRCPACGADIITATFYETGTMTWIVALVLCFFFG
ncbi:hypothetical protein ScPMuIL_003667 [Solemya velum]